MYSNLRLHDFLKKMKFYIYLKKDIFFSFTLYPAHSRVGRGNVVLRHSVPHFPPSFFLEALRIEWRNSTPRFGSTQEGRNEIINVYKYWLFSSGEPTTSRFCRHTLCLCATTSLDIPITSIKMFIAASSFAFTNLTCASLKYKTNLFMCTNTIIKFPV